jgi:hypothetical protein
MLLLHDLSWRAVIEPLDEPAGVVDVAECEQREPELLDGVEGPDPERVLLERPDEALRAAIALRRADERRRAPDAHDFSLSLRDVELILAERGVVVSYETVRRWCKKFAASFADRLRRRRPHPGDKWHIDEVFIRIQGVQRYL